MTDGIIHLTEEERQTLADGTIAADREQAARAHLRDCAACADDVARLERLTMRARQSEHPATELADLWPGIRSRIEGSKVLKLSPESSAPGRTRARARWRIGTIGVLAAALVATVWLGVRLSPGRDSQAIAGARADTGAAIEFADDSVRAYKEEAQLLLDRLELTRSMLDPSAAAAIDKDLAVIDSAIDELQTAIARDPRNPALQRLLAMSYREKVEVLLRASNAG